MRRCRASERSDVVVITPPPARRQPVGPRAATRPFDERPKARDLGVAHPLTQAGEQVVAAPLVVEIGIRTRVGLVDEPGTPSVKPPAAGGLPVEGPFGG